MERNKTRASVHTILIILDQRIKLSSVTAEASQSSHSNLDEIHMQQFQGAHGNHPIIALK